jgi:hypothetical protein
MYGQGTAPPPPPASQAENIGLRVLFTVLPLITLGFGAWGSMLRLAMLLKRTHDWVLLAVSAGLVPIMIVLFANSTDDNDWQINSGAACVLFCMFATPVYFLVVDIRRTGAVARRYLAYQQQMQQQGRQDPRSTNPYSYRSDTGPSAAPGPVQGPISGRPGIPARPPYGYGPAARTPGPAPTPTPSPATPAPMPGPNSAAPPAPPAPGPRMDQVRAELDELSNLLRKEEEGG